MTETAYRKVNVVDADGNLISFGGGGSGGGGDASATNQETEITRLGEIRDAISDRLPSAELTPSFISVTNSGTIASGRQSISFVNFGNNAGT
ncbi:MAG TPA: hypothetical protein VE944_10430, partial [Nostoc sp.]|uniref:hypothetical protein n=1 Tax=Nostoc sp. TaxID=1180 RepID=UPI002D3BD312